ncbi:MAG: L-threonylcarbamoyladenylate synthase [Pseudomonadota bacterium]
MQTQLVKVNSQEPEPEVIATAAELLRAGELVAFPTETVYGLGANALDCDALGKIFTAKQRPRSDPIIAHIADLGQLDEITRGVPSSAYRLADVFWPGPLTLILQRKDSMPEAIAEGRSTIAVRMPAHPVARALLEKARVPVGAPSANTFTRPSATTAAHVMEDLSGRIAMILDGGPTSIGLESTVLDLTAATPRVLRPGGVSLEALRDVDPTIEFQPAYVSEQEGSHSPGQMLKHYSPRARVLLFRGDDRKAVLRRMEEVAAAEAQAGLRVAALLSDEDAAALTGLQTVERLGPVQDLDRIARHLFAGLRALDRHDTDLILLRDPGRKGLGAALWDRMLRAAEGEVITC